ncbi:hypothetical protein GZ77_22010 [Endozoicomonas montiporae]|uniref:Uncharacterized protein n=2 Tax=Endozoicomonas montiporae TaxID=1027273 RepID=A0A081N037_9GAMM|nr:hypothetical protein [Endozoicomonas montiporae]AMO58827.1 hypothetical protein EZMO1_4944 [Endozoicomonas montiporae CL-33]KEQ11810.1 hypothetical protein GZ77_22010 [Endozoicomonas montiporae]
MKVTRESVRAYFKKHINFAYIKHKIALKFGFKVKNKDEVSPQISRKASTEGNPSKSKSIGTRKTAKSESPAVKEERKQACKLYDAMLTHWMSGQPEEAVDSLAKLYDQIDKMMKLENHGAIAADDYADRARSIMLDLTKSMSFIKKCKIHLSTKPGGEIYRGLRALTFLQNGRNSDGEVMRYGLSDKAQTYLVHAGPLYMDLFRKFHPLTASRLEKRIMDETDPNRAQSARQVTDSEAAFKALSTIE